MSKLHPVRTKKCKTVTTVDPAWFQAQETGTVEVALHKSGKGKWHVSVWGPDDSGMDKSGEMDDCMVLYDKIKDGVSRKALQELGFQDAS